MANPPLIRTARVLHFHLCRSFLLRKYSSSSSSSFGLQFLVKELRIPLKLNSSLSQKIDFDEKASSNVKSVITFFKSREFSEAEIARVIQKEPRILRCRISSTLDPKFQCLIANGFKGSFLRRIVLGNPFIFRASLSYTFEPTLRFLKTVLGSNESVSAAVSRDQYLFKPNTASVMKHNIDYLAKQGMPDSKVRKLILYSPTVMLLSSDKMVFWVEKVKDLGVMPHDPVFWNVLRTRSQMSESTWKRKVEVFKSLGWSDEGVMSTFAAHPLCLATSEKKLRASFEFIVKKMGIPPEVIIARPVMLSYSLQERIIPRLGLLKLLEAEKLLSRKWRAQTILGYTEEKFIRIFILKYLDRIPGLMETYQRSKKSGILGTKQADSHPPSVPLKLQSS